METPGGSIGPDQVAEAMTWPGIIGLGEMMNFPDVYNSDVKMHAEMSATRSAHKIIGGHYPSNDLSLPFHGYVAGGADDDHEGTRMEDAAARVRQGMKAMLRFGSAWHDVAEGVRAITELGLDPRHFILCTDDSHSQTLFAEGHVDRAVRQAIAHGINPITAIQMTTLNTAEHFGVAKDMGMIAPGRYADILIVKDLIQLKPNFVIAKGHVVVENDSILIDIPPYHYPEWAKNSIHLNKPITSADFVLRVENFSPDENQPIVIANVIGVIENQAPTRHLRMEMRVAKGEVHADLARDIAKVAIIERHHSTGRVQVGLVSGFGFDTPCAIGSTVAHDSHHMLIVGTDDMDMALAANELAQMAGGQIVVSQGNILGQLALPIAGLMSDDHVENVAKQVSTILAGFRTCGCTLNNPNMQLSLLGLVVIPELRISDLGLVDVNQFKFIPVLESALDSQS